MKREFTAKLLGRGPGSAWVYITIPFDVRAVFGSKGRVPVCGAINGFPFRTSLVPEGDGTHYMAVNKTMQAGAGANTGDTVAVVMERDAAERVVAVPPELDAALRASGDAREAFAKLSYSHRKEYADWVASAKKSETRIARAGKAAQMLAGGKRVK
jgi:hypothetical protein